MAWQHLRDDHPSARKPHRCYLCEQEIASGERHVYRTGLSGREFTSFRMHEKCSRLAQEIYGYDDWDCHDPMEFRESLEAERKKFRTRS